MKNRSRNKIFNDKNHKMEKEEGEKMYDKRSIGEQTREKLKKNGIVSPSTKILVKISHNLHIAPKREFKTDQEKEQWICEMKQKYCV